MDEEEQPGTFHLKLNAYITRDYEDIEYFISDWSHDPQMSHRYVKTARELLIVTVKSCLPRQRESIKKILEHLHSEYPRNINVLANLAHLCNSLLLVDKSQRMQTKLSKLLTDQSKGGRLDRARALAEKAFILLGDVPSQETLDDIGKLKTAIKWLSRATEDGKAVGMDDEEELVWMFHLAKSRFRLENRYNQGETSEEQRDERQQNFAAMLDCFGRVYLFGEDKPDMAVYRAMSLVYPAEIFSRRSLRKLPAIPELYSQSPELQGYHVNPVSGCRKAVEVYDCYAVHNRFARVLMNQHDFNGAMGQVKLSLRLNRNVNWFGYNTRLQICKNWYRSQLNRRNVCKNMLHEALEEVDSCRYRSASLLLDIADIHYYLGIDPSTKASVDPAELEKAVEFVMLARERVEGYMNVRAHAQLGHILWALGSQRPAIECMKRAVELEKPGYQSNIRDLCHYLLTVCRGNVDLGDKIVFEVAAVFTTGRQKLGKEDFLKQLALDDTLYDVLKKILQRMLHSEQYKQFAEELCEDLNFTINIDSGGEFAADLQAYKWQRPANCQSTGFRFDFFIMSAPADCALASNILEELESRECEGHNTYKGLSFLPDRDVLWGRSIFDAFEEHALASKILIVIISSDFCRDHVCRLVLDEMLMTRSQFTPVTGAYCGPYDRRTGQQHVVPIIDGDCQLPFGLLSSKLLIRCNQEHTVPPADMLRLRRLLKNDTFCVE